MNILLLTSHSIAEHDDLAMLSKIAPTFSIGAYSNPAKPEDPKRPPLDVPYYAELHAACRETREQMGDPGEMIDWAKGYLPKAVLDWADVLIAHHYLDRWIIPQYSRLQDAGVRVIWRTNGQSSPELEYAMAKLPGLEIIRYSPNERHIPYYAGASAVIRFGKDPAEWYGWHGFDRYVGNVSQHMAQRGTALNYDFWRQATDNLPALPAGPGSESIGGLGELEFDAMQRYLRRARCYLYTGTLPAPYTLGLIEAMMTGCPVVSVSGPAWAQSGPSWLADLFEGDEITGLSADTPEDASRELAILLEDWDAAEAQSMEQRQHAIELFDLATVTKQWRDFLGA